ncbi:hypothetical protein B6I21_05775 [candidate division KSB1 bacterium 4572_119]|nr:MAG: hypothetical protein B6I21_05775 [candidate division KSB1 bacterium 4572_119]
MYLDHLTDEQFQLYLDGLPTEGISDIEEHLKTCEECRSQLSAYKLVYKELNIEPESALLPGFENAIISRIRKKAEQKQFIRNLLTQAAMIILGSTLPLYFLLTGKISDDLNHIFVNNWFGTKHLWENVFGFIRGMNVSTELVVSALIILVVFSLIERILPFSGHRKAALFKVF